MLSVDPQFDKSNIFNVQNKKIKLPIYKMTDPDRYQNN